MDPTTAVIQMAARFSMAVVVLSMALVFIRMVMGPRSADRVVALDLIAVLIVAFLAVFTVHEGNTSFLDVAIAYALVAFLGTVALARYLLRSKTAAKSRPPEEL
jgi:multicomponent Na+:H+ antiporter subunit F